MSRCFSCFCIIHVLLISCNPSAFVIYALKNYLLTYLLTNLLNIRERKTWMQSEFCTWQNYVRGKSPKMYIWCTSPGDGQRPCKVWLASGERRRCTNEVKTRNRKFAGMPQTRQQISAISGPKSAILWSHLEEILLFKSFFLIVDTCHSCEDIAGQVVRSAIFCVICASCIFSEPRAAHFRHTF